MPAPFKYKLDVLAALKEAGFSTYRLRKEHILGEKSINSFRNGEMVNLVVLGHLCGILGCDIGDLIEYDAAASQAKPMEEE